MYVLIEELVLMHISMHEVLPRVHINTMAIRNWTAVVTSIMIIRPIPASLKNDNGILIIELVEEENHNIILFSESYFLFHLR